MELVRCNSEMARRTLKWFMLVTIDEKVEMVY